ncbi:SDR family NAD(P)-dependent oxidoreductase [Pseudonocardia acaciae]|uniref:SDR family NAD(P)-dependent oxidoreductase n=1 Tax=Pseudonocardia acaciae TaxID=551276 RepID=UPI000490F3E4|nr:SDR family oxidoreductase [Pseudonocardia acaciae]
MADAAPTAVITGANSGIGLECGRQLVEAGWTVHGLDVRTDELAAQRGVHPVECDVTSEDSVADAFSLVGDRLDALVCSAGVLRTGALMEMPTADFDTVFQVNTRGPWLCARAALPLLTRDRTESTPPGRIVMVGSISAVRPKAGGGAYSASKASLAQLVRVMGVELAPRHLRVNAVAPATVDTPMIRRVQRGEPSAYRPSGPSPLGRVSTPADIVAVIRFLLSPASDYITGATLPVDGGTSAAIPG